MEALAHNERVAIARLHALLELLPTALDRELATIGLTSFEFILLEALQESDAGRLRLTALAKRTNATLPRLSRVVTGLERKGLVQRSACEEDGRATNAVLTPAGGTAYESSKSVYSRAVRAMILDGMNADAVDQLAQLAFSILSNLDPQFHDADNSDAACSADPAPENLAVEVPSCPADP